MLSTELSGMQSSACKAQLAKLSTQCSVRKTQYAKQHAQLCAQISARTALTYATQGAAREFQHTQLSMHCLARKLHEATLSTQSLATEVQRATLSTESPA